MKINVEINCQCSWSGIISINDRVDYKCDNCNRELFKIHIITGYVYVLSNPSMPNLLKIGYTERYVYERVSELNTTGVPVAFEVEAIFDSSNPYEDEKEIHNLLSEYRMSNNREFFSVDLENAIASIQMLLNRQPSFVKSPEIMMNDKDGAIFVIKSHIKECEKVRDDYLSIMKSNKKEWDYLTSFVKKKSDRRVFKTENDKFKYEYQLINKLIVDKFYMYDSEGRQRSSDFFKNLENMYDDLYKVQNDLIDISSANLFE
ncbi:GIY-YIG nuclease family protein [Vibrio metschnikovii]|uniref:GIY-YIG nuclease family protein n=1 Tax=Vibrio metschnikovii TaxID=28172 RepID=UPI001C30F05D|nr:GIY-YIG nuclease family protein [Vibrio metschnikovii]